MGQRKGNKMKISRTKLRRLMESEWNDIRKAEKQMFLDSEEAQAAAKKEALSAYNFLSLKGVDVLQGDVGTDVDNALFRLYFPTEKYKAGTDYGARNAWDAMHMLKKGGFDYDYEIRVMGKWLHAFLEKPDSLRGTTVLSVYKKGDGPKER